MSRWIALGFLVMNVSVASAQEGIDLSKRPTDATSYCERVNGMDSLPEYTGKMVEAVRLFAGLARENKLDRPKLDSLRGDFSKIHAAGIDDVSATLAKRVLERINVAVPRKDAYNQDQVVSNFLGWFAACASEMKTEKGYASKLVIFLNPLSDETDRFFQAPADKRAATLREILGPPGIGKLNSRDIEARTGLAFNGINPRWVLPIALAMEGADMFVPDYARKATAKAVVFAQELQTSAAEAERQVKEDEAAAESAQYAGVRALDAFSRNTAIAPGFAKCVKGERDFQLQTASSIEAEAQKADTQKDQKALLDEAVYRRTNIAAVATGMCLYRLNVGLLLIETNDEALSINLGPNVKDRGKEDLGAKFTVSGLAKVAELLNMAAKEFHSSKISEPIRKSQEELGQQQAYTTRQKQQQWNDKMIMSMAGTLIYGGIFENIVAPIVNGKVGDR